MVIRIVFFFCTIFFIVSCSDLEKANDVKNPTSYIFNCPEFTLKKAIPLAFGNLKYHGMILSYLGSPYVPIDSASIFLQSGNQGDFYLNPSRFLFGKSLIYRRGRKSLDYVASFHLHIEQIDSGKTKVSVITIKPRIVIGKELFPRGPHFVRPLKLMEVEPSTVEEYEILLEIGKIVDEKNMIPLIYPK